MRLSLDERYPWRQQHNTTAQYPWDRYLNHEYFKHEQRILQNTGTWLKTLNKTNRGSDLPETQFYAVPVKLSSGWRTAINHLSNQNEQHTYRFKGLSATPRSLNNPVLALFPRNTPIPPDYTLIRATKATKHVLINRKLGTSLNVAEITEYESLDSDTIYVDVPYEKNIVKKILTETLTPDERITQPFQYPVLSAPHSTHAGGITLSSLSTNSTFATELIKTIQKLVPPEYSALKNPKSVEKGRWLEHINGITYKLSEATDSSRNIFSGLAPSTYEPVTNTLKKREKFRGEFSVFSTIKTPTKNTSEILNELFLNFTHTDITLPYELDELIEHDIYLKPLNNAINEDLWIQIANARHLLPPTPHDHHIENLLNTYLKDFDIILTDHIPNDTARNHLVKKLAREAKTNSIRIAQAIARSREEETTHKKDLTTARHLTLHNLEEFKQHATLKKIEQDLRRTVNTDRKDLVQNYFSTTQKATTNQIYDGIKSSGLFRDLHHLQTFLDELDRNGDLLYNHIDQTYRWITHT